MSDTYYFSPERLRQAITELCLASGSPQEEADLLTGRLIKADLVGHPSHGIIRIPMYLGMIRIDLIKPGAVPSLSIDHGSIVVVDGNGAYGQVGAEHAMKVAIERGRAHGVAAVGVTNLGHIGRLADYAVSASQANCIGMVYTTCGGAASLVAPFEGCSRRMATNPMAMAIPSDREYPIVFDMATSVFAEGKLRVMMAADKKAPDEALLDKEGNPTNNPRDFYAGGTLLPLGGKQGYKGYLLNFMVEVLGGLLINGGYIGREENAKFSNSTLMIVIDVEKFRKMSQFKTELEDLLKYLKETPVAEGKEVLYPGEVEARKEAETLKSGIPLAEKTVEKIQEEMDRYNVPIKLADLGETAPLG
ncbi:MAG: Ldh family oxidoreductase [Deltaproteobacteria bacterium]|nr:Ldh family oxidoreductase [Deltaproteobacteria bacterium]MBW2053565.1 Ldh family oxidoreductase [Deltaproteobacteria bacterium]MBW2142114.1 Ldh family oxidoreductase [Deltaproteobacteria bacterium]MBW2324090.1 Ldh family oxidoreductase [Deltaproteobacteria bacterium]